MNNLPRQKLQEIIKRYGQVIIDDPRRCRVLRNLTKLKILNIGGCPHINRRGIAVIEHPGLTVDYA